MKKNKEALKKISKKVEKNKKLIEEKIGNPAEMEDRELKKGMIYAVSNEWFKDSKAIGKSDNIIFCARGGNYRDTGSVSVKKNDNNELEVDGMVFKNPELLSNKEKKKNPSDQLEIAYHIVPELREEEPADPNFSGDLKTAIEEHMKERLREQEEDKLL